MSPLDPRPFIETGRALRRKSPRTQMLALGALAAFWIVNGVVFHQAWLIAVGAVIVIVMGLRFVQVRREATPDTDDR